MIRALWCFVSRTIVPFDERFVTVFITLDEVIIIVPFTSRGGMLAIIVDYLFYGACKWSWLVVFVFTKSRLITRIWGCFWIFLKNFSSFGIVLNCTG